MALAVYAFVVETRGKEPGEIRAELAARAGGSRERARRACAACLRRARVRGGAAAAGAPSAAYGRAARALPARKETRCPRWEGWRPRRRPLAAALPPTDPLSRRPPPSSEAAEVKEISGRAVSDDGDI